MYAAPTGKFTPGEQTMFGYATEMDTAAGAIAAVGGGAIQRRRSVYFGWGITNEIHKAASSVLSTARGQAIVAELQSAKAQYDNTVIFFSSDNGAPPASTDVNHQIGQNPGGISRGP
jgi:hypothetical protein